MNNQDWRKNGIWPVHLQPQKDELLSSWIIRLAYAHGFKVESFCTKVFGYRSTIWNRDIDVLAPIHVLDAIQRISGCTEHQVRSTTLKSFEGRIFEEINTGGINHWILSLGIKHRNRTLKSLMFCPKCLEEDEKPYFRRSWRLGFITICLKHKCFLKVECENCHSVIAPHRSDMLIRSTFTESDLMVKCWKCGFDLRMASSTGIIENDLYELQYQLEQTLKNGWCSWSGNGSMNSVIFFEGMHQVASGLISKKTRIKIQEISYDDKIVSIERLSLDYRHKLMAYLSHVLNDWPNKFISHAIAYNFRYSDLKGDRKNIIYWYDNILNWDIRSEMSALSDDEKKSIINSLEAKQGIVTNKGVKEISGKNISVYVKSLKKMPIDDSVYNELLISLDHEVSETLDLRKRSELIRDKIMFASGRVLNLNIRQLSELLLSDVDSSFDVECESVCFNSNAITGCDIHAWLSWYINNIRKPIAFYCNENNVFLSEYTKKGLKKSVIGMRFNRAVRAANLCREIKSYHDWHH